MISKIREEDDISITYIILNLYPKEDIAEWFAYC